MHLSFWKEHPAFLAGLNLLIGTSCFLFWETPWNWIFLSLWSLYLLYHRFWPSLLLTFGAFAYAFCLYPKLEAPQASNGYFSISSLQPHQTPFQKGLLYKGSLAIDGRKIPCSIHTKSENRPAADCDYIVSGTLKQRGPYEFAFKAKQWLPLGNSFSLAELRYRAKEALRRFLEQKLPSPRTAALLGSLMTGDVEDRSLRYEFSRVGLQHILAISGFHFGLLIAFCSFFLSLFLSSRWKLIALLLCVNAYFFFVGSSPAVQRSWLTASLYLFGKLIGRHTTGVNLLGTALCVETIADPLVSANIGFQLSFLSCLGILLFYPLFDKPLRFALPKRSVSETDALDLFSKHGFLAASFLRQALSLTLAVNLAIFPLLLYHFHQFPLLGLLYNLFFPFFLSIALFSLLVSGLVHLIFPLLAIPLFQITDFLTAQLLDLASYPPLALDYSIRTLAFPAWAIPLYLSVLFILSRRFSKN